MIADQPDASALASGFYFVIKKIEILNDDNKKKTANLLDQITKNGGKILTKKGIGALNAGNR